MHDTIRFFLLVAWVSLVFSAATLMAYILFSA